MTSPMSDPASDLPDEELVKRFEDLLWRVGDKIGQRHNDGGFEARIQTELGSLRWMTLVGAFMGKAPFTDTAVHSSVDCFDDTGVVFKQAKLNGKFKEEPVYSYSVMRQYLPLLEAQIPLELLSEVNDDESE